MDTRRSGKRWWPPAAAMALAVVASGCTHNPVLGKWQIERRLKESNDSYLDRLSSNIRSSAGARIIEFRKDSIAVTGGAKSGLETGIKYRIQELESGGTEVRIFQPREGDPRNWDIDVCRVDHNNETAQLESPSELVELRRIDN